MSPPVEGANVTARLAELARRHPDRPALLGGEAGAASITYRELWRSIDGASAGLRRLGLAPGDRALVFIPMSIDLYVALLALLKMGAVAVFVDPWIGLRQVAAYAAFAAPRAFLGTPRSQLLRLAFRPLRSLPVAVTTGRRLGSMPAAATLAELAAAAGDGSVFPASPEAPALITFTSGSSGVPKGVNRTHGFLWAQHRALAAELPPEEGDVDFTTFPVFALNNLAGGIPSVVPGVDLRRIDEADPEAVLGSMRARGVTTATASPPLVDRLAAAVERVPARRPPLRRLVSGGAPVADSQLEAWRRAFPRAEIVLAYGSSEAEPVARIGAEERLAAGGGRGTCAGRPVAAVRTRLVRIHRGPIELGAEGWGPWEVASGEVGELLVAGEHVARDYFRNPAAGRENKVTESGGRVWHRMGDTGHFDPDGRLWLVGRVHSTIFRRGEAVHAQLVEQAARGEDPRIRRVAAVGLPDPEVGERLVVVVESRSGRAVGREVAARLAAAGLPADRVLVSRRALPVDPRHRSKIDYPRLRSRLGHGAECRA
jgi:acyl-CoA synthetase (AMP-forming)/AMP-acid ligase II